MHSLKMSTTSLSRKIKGYFLQDASLVIAGITSNTRANVAPWRNSQGGVVKSQGSTPAGKGPEWESLARWSCNC